MDELAFAQWVDQLEAALRSWPNHPAEQRGPWDGPPWVWAFAQPTKREAQLATDELHRRGYDVLIISVRPD